MGLSSDQIANSLRAGQIAIIPTDTIYGLHTSAFIPESVEKIYKLKGRDNQKPFIILISSIKDLSIFKINLNEHTKKILEKIWPGRVSIILPCPQKFLEYLHRGKNSLAFRIPDNTDLLELLKKTGPLVSTSANPEGQKPAETIEQAEAYFGDNIDLYVNAGRLKSMPSTLARIEDDKIIILRQGSAIFNSDLKVMYATKNSTNADKRPNLNLRN